VRLEAAAKIFGTPLMSSGIPAYCPPILETGQALSAAPALSGTLPPLRSLVCLRAAQLAGCPFCMDPNAVGSSKAGASAAKNAAVECFRESDLFNPAEKT